MRRRKRFEVVFEPDEGGAWNASIPAVRGCVTWGRSLVAARRYIREALATCVDELGGRAQQIAHDAQLDERFVLGEQSQNALDEYLAARTQAAEIQKLMQARATLAAKVLTKHLSLRDAGELLGLSHERVSQVIARNASARAVDSSRKAKRAKRIKGAASRA